MTDRVTQTVKKLRLADGVEYDIVPLTLRESKNAIPLLKELETMGNEMSDELIQKTAELCHKILSKTVKDLTVDRVLDLVDLSNVQQLIMMATGRA